MSIFLARCLRKKHQAEKDTANGQSSDESSGPSQPTQISDKQSRGGGILLQQLHKKPKVWKMLLMVDYLTNHSEPSQ